MKLAKLAQRAARGKKPHTDGEATKQVQDSKAGENRTLKPTAKRTPSLMPKSDESDVADGKTNAKSDAKPDTKTAGKTDGKSSKSSSVVRN